MKIQILNLNPSFDHNGILKHRTELDVVRTDEVVAVANGKGVDVARVLKTLGYNNYQVSNIIGGDVGDLYEKKIKKEGINCWNYRIKNDTRINYVLVDEIRDSTLMINENGPQIKPGEKKEYMYKLATWLEENQILVLSGSATSGFKGEDIRYIWDMAREREMYTIVDTSQELLKASIKSNLNLIKVNRREFIEIFGTKYNYSFADHDDIIRVIEKENLSEVIITLGKEGALLYNKGQVLRGENKKIFSNYALGSGDSFLAGYLYGYVNGYNVRKKFKLAMACGAANTKQYGQGRLSYDDVQKIKTKYIRIDTCESF